MTGIHGTLGALGALALGAGLMYVLDPDRGPRRRARLKRQARRASLWTADTYHQARKQLRPFLLA